MVRNFAEYGTYKGDPVKAVKLLHKHHPEVPLSACEQHFHNYLRVFNEVIEFVQLHNEYYWREYKEGYSDGPRETTKEEKDFIKCHGEVPPGIIDAMIGWVFFWHHLK